MSEQGIRAEIAGRVRRVVVKVGTSVLNDEHGHLSHESIVRIVRNIAEVARQGKEVVLVSSGAIAAGLGAMDLQRRPAKMRSLQAAAAIGQGILMQEYYKAFRAEDLLCAQVLLTNDDLKDRNRCLNIRNTFEALLERGAVPVVNENDTVSTQEIRFGDNDLLSTLVAQLMHADMLVLLSNVDGLLREEGGSKTLVGLLEATDNKAGDHVWKGTSRHGTGGMASKLAAARMMGRAGDATVIANGQADGILARILAGDNVGTMLIPKSGRMAGRKRWIAYFGTVKGSLVVDDGAKRALADGKKSLLAPGVRRIAGEFRAGDTVGIADGDGHEFGRGIVGYSAQDLHRVLGKRSKEIAAVLGRKGPDEVIHRDDLVLL